MRTPTQISLVVEEMFLACFRLGQTFRKLFVALARHPAAQRGRLALRLRSAARKLIEVPFNLAVTLQLQP